MELIKQLRERSGAGMMDCKKALDEAGNDLEKALEFLRKKGIAKAAKREGREAKEGCIQLAVNEAGNEGYIVEVNAETDFVARNEKFQNFAKAVLDLIICSKPVDMNALLALKLAHGTVKEDLDALSGTIGEKLAIKNFNIVAGASVAGYSHLGGKIGVLVALDTVGKQDLALDMAMQVAAANPKYIDPSEVPAADIDKEKEIEREVLAKENKPAAMMEKILAGKVNKFFEAVCLVKQEYIKNDKQKVEQVLNGVKVVKFVRYSL
ncbi:MAG TPA: translation elongation factor Ts [Candidatus Nanoarchaeia archaeon]|nr:translation elongation factor Ts [Candidatus Nanoarchaeia archaeon]